MGAIVKYNDYKRSELPCRKIIGLSKNNNKFMDYFERCNQEAIFSNGDFYCEIHLKEILENK